MKNELLSSLKFQNEKLIHMNHKFLYAVQRQLIEVFDLAEKVKEVSPALAEELGNVAIAISDVLADKDLTVKENDIGQPITGLWLNCSFRNCDNFLSTVQVPSLETIQDKQGRQKFKDRLKTLDLPSGEVEAVLEGQCFAKALVVIQIKDDVEKALEDFCCILEEIIPVITEYNRL